MISHQMNFVMLKGYHNNNLQVNRVLCRSTWSWCPSSIHLKLRDRSTFSTEKPSRRSSAKGTAEFTARRRSKSAARARSRGRWPTCTSTRTTRPSSPTWSSRNSSWSPTSPRTAATRKTRRRPSTDRSKLVLRSLLGERVLAGWKTFLAYIHY